MNPWSVVALVLERYTPAMVAGLSAIKLLLEDFSPPEELRAYQGPIATGQQRSFGRLNRRSACSR
jgi:hypothetical protein